MKEYRVVVKPGSSKGPLVVEDGDELVVYVRQRAFEGKANEAVTKLLAEYLNVPKTKLTIKRGRSSRHKTIIIND